MKTLFGHIIALIFLSLLSPQRGNKEKNTGLVSNEKWSDEERRHFKKEEFYWKVSSIVGALALISAAAAAGFAFGAYQETKRQASVAQQALDLSTRPWIFIENVIATGPLVVEDGEVTITVKANVKNYAQSPALGAAFFPNLYNYLQGFHFQMRRQRISVSQSASRGY